MKEVIIYIKRRLNKMSLKSLFESKERKFEEIFKNRFTIIVIILLAMVILCITLTNDAFYKKPIARITTISEKMSEAEALSGGKEQIKNQQIKAIIENGKYKGREIQLENTASYSEVNDLDLNVNDEVFISVQENPQNNSLNCKIIDFKRDKYIVYIAVFFIILTIIIGGIKGIRSIASLLLNIFIFFIAIALFLYKANLTIICILASILFIILSILIVCGKNKKAFSAIIATILGTSISVLAAVLVIQLNNWNGVHMEEMEFLTHPPKQIFLMEILIGTLGGIMDIAISISAAIYEIYDKNPLIEIKNLMKSGISIGKDIMGTMANTLVFAYVSGSIPMILLVMRNDYPLSYIININLSLEIIRALTGSIGIVLSIPITIATCVLLAKK